MNDKHRKVTIEAHQTVCYRQQITMSEQEFHDLKNGDSDNVESWLDKHDIYHAAQCEDIEIIEHLDEDKIQVHHIEE